MQELFRRRLLVVPLLLAVPIAATGVQLDPTSLDKREELMSGGAIELELSASPGPGGFTGGGSPPRVSTNVQVNDPQSFLPDGLVGRSETSVVTSNGGQQLLAGWNDADGFCFLNPGLCTSIPQLGLSGFGYSTDGGKTWTDGGAPPLFDDQIYTFGDPWLDRGGFDKQTYYYSNIGASLLTGSFGMSIHRGHFSGKSFAWEDVRLVLPEILTGPGGGDFLDKEAIAAEKDGSGVVIMSLTNFLDLAARGQCPNASPIGFGEIQVFRSTDAGDTWGGPIVVGPDLTDLTADPGCNVGVSQQSSSPAFGPQGDVYVVWERGPFFDFEDAMNPFVSPEAEIVVSTSFDGGASWSDPVVVDDVNHMRGAPPVAYNRNRINNHPRIAVAQNGTHKGRIYVTYTSMAAPVSGIPVVVPCPVPSAQPCVAQNLTSAQAYLSHSDDRGSTWSAPVPIAGPVPAEGKKRVWPTVSVEPGGNVDIVYYESLEEGLTPDPADIECNLTLQGGVRRAGTAVSLVDTYWVRSSDGGRSFNAPVRVSDVSTNWCQVASNIVPNMGDYIFSVSKGNHVFPTWAEGRNGVPDTFFAVGLGAGKSGK